MPGCSTCHDHQPAQSVSPTYKKVLWVALVVNLGMFIVEVASGLKAGSVSLLADSLDFFGDAANYAVSLFVLGMALSIRAKAALVKGATLGIFGVGVLAYTAYRLWTGQVPEPLTMGVVKLAQSRTTPAADAFIELLKDSVSDHPPQKATAKTQKISA